MAAGFSLIKENIEPLRRALNDNSKLSDDDFVQVINVDMLIEFESATFALYDSLNSMSPFGKENKEPLLGTLNAKVNAVRMIDEKNTIILTFDMKNGRRMKGVCFGKNDVFRAMVEGGFDEYDSEKILSGILRNIDFRLDIIYYLSINEYNGDVSMQLNIKDFRLHKML